MTLQEGFTVKEIVLGIQRDVLTLTGKIDGHINTHTIEQLALAERLSDPKATPLGTRLQKDINDVADAGRDTRKIVNRHDVMIQRLIGASALLSALGGTALLLALLRLGGVIH